MGLGVEHGKRLLYILFAGVSASYSWRASDSGCLRGGGAQVFSSMRKRAGWSASLPPAWEARRESDRRPSPADPPESSRGGGWVCGVSAVDCLKGLAVWRGGGQCLETSWSLIYVGKYIASNLAHCRFRVGLKVLNSSPASSMDFEALKGLLRRVAEEVEAEIKQVEKELAEARRAGGGAVCN